MYLARVPKSIQVQQECNLGFLERECVYFASKSFLDGCYLPLSFRHMFIPGCYIYKYIELIQFFCSSCPSAWIFWTKNTHWIDPNYLSDWLCYIVNVQLSDVSAVPNLMLCDIVKRNLMVYIFIISMPNVTFLYC